MVKNFIYLTDIPIFSTLNEKETELVLKNSIRKKIPENCVINLEGQPATVFALLTHGRAKAVLFCDDGRQILLHFYKPGDFFGEMNFGEINEWTYSIQTVTPAEFVFISLDTITQLIKQNGEFALSFITFLSKSLNRTQNRLRDTIYERGENKIMKYFSYIATDIGVKEDDGTLIPEKLSHQIIGDTCGLTRETVSRHLRQMQSQGLISKRKDGWFLHKKKQ